MHLALLKKLRVPVSVVFFVCIGLIFIDFGNFLPSWYITAATYLQFTPSLMAFVHIVGISSLGFAVVILITLLFGRVYCSSICPLGTLQDAVIFLKRKFRRRDRFRYLKPWNTFRLALLSVVILSLLTGTMIAVNILDPYSVFGRIMVELFRPLVILVNNLLSLILKAFNNFAVQPVAIRGFMITSLLFALAFLAVPVAMSLFRGRQYCNTICPVGILLGYISRLSVFRIRLDKEVCNRCGACMFTCKAGCIDVKNREVDFSRCIACFNCLGACDAHGVKYEPVWRNRTKTLPEGPPDLSKRNFLALSALFAFSAVNSLTAQPGQQRQQRRRQGMHDQGNNLPVTPPGSVGVRHFTNACTSCYLCVSACPSQVLQPALAAYGWQGLFMPVMDYKVSFCNYDCVVCTEVCPTGAILPLTFEQKKEVQLGKARFIKRECIVHTKRTACGACSEHCPTKAVNMVPYKWGLTIPEVTEDICVGCGACEYACPTDPKAIVVDANPVHLKAQLPDESGEEEEVDYREEFPF